MPTLREKLADRERFLVASELVSVRGSMAGVNAIKARDFANDLVACPEIDWISITDNAGGNPQLAPLVLGRPILYAGKEVVIHLTCKDLNRNGLESEAWMLNSEGFNNILAMTGAIPQAPATHCPTGIHSLLDAGLLAVIPPQVHLPRVDKLASLAGHGGPDSLRRKLPKKRLEKPAVLRKHGQVGVRQRRG